jgi:chromosome segregation ATPase
LRPLSFLPAASGYYLPEIGDNNRTMFGSLLSWAWKEMARPGGEQEVEIEGKKYKLPPNIHTGTTVTVASLPDRPDLSYVFRYTPVTLKAPASGDVAEVVKGTTSKESEVFRVATFAEEVKRLTEARKPLEEENKRLSDKITAAEGEKRHLEQAKREVEEKLRRAEKAALDKQKELEEKLRAASVSVADTGHTRMQYQEMEKKHDAMFKSYGKLESDINRLKDEKAAVEKERAAVKTTLDEVNSRLAEATIKITALESAKTELAAENSRLTTALAEATEKGKASQEEADKLAERLNEALLAAAAAADLETDGNKAAVESLKAELEKAKRDSDDTIASLQVLLQQHKEKLQALTADKESSQQEIDEFKDGLRELTSELSSARVEGYRLRGQLAAAQQQTTEANKKSESLSSEVTALETEKAAMKGQLDTALGELETTKTDLQSTKEVLTRTAAELESAKSNGGAMTEALEQAKQKAQEEADSTRKERDQARAEAEEARRQAASEKEEAERASTDLAGRLASLTEVVAAAAKKHQSEVSDLRAELEKERKEKKALQDAHDASQVGVCEIEDDRRRKAELIATLTAEHTRMEEEAKENAATLKKFKEENADLQAQMFDLKAKLEDKEASHGSSSVIARLEREID